MVAVASRPALDFQLTDGARSDERSASCRFLASGRGRGRRGSALGAAPPGASDAADDMAGCHGRGPWPRSSDKGLRYFAREPAGDESESGISRAMRWGPDSGNRAKYQSRRAVVQRPCTIGVVCQPCPFSSASLPSRFRPREDERCSPFLRRLSPPTWPFAAGFSGTIRDFCRTVTSRYCWELTRAWDRAPNDRGITTPIFPSAPSSPDPGSPHPWLGGRGVPNLGDNRGGHTFTAWPAPGHPPVQPQLDESPAPKCWS
jgi:hypothetical protein